MNEQLHFVVDIANRLDSAGIPYMVTGSMASAFYVRPRMTRDIDIVIECGPADAGAIVRLFEPDCYVSEESVRDAIARHSMFNVIQNEWVVKADFIVRKDDAYRKTEFSRRRRVDIEGQRIWIVAPEDLILSKLRWSLDGGSELQQDDVRAMVQAVPDLDWRYLEEWAAYLGVSESLAKAKDL